MPRRGVLLLCLLGLIVLLCLLGLWTVRAEAVGLTSCFTTGVRLCPNDPLAGGGGPGGGVTSIYGRTGIVSAQVGDYSVGQVTGAESAANKNTNVALGLSDTDYPSQRAVKLYVDSAVAGVSVTPSFSSVASGVNVTATMTVGTGASLTTSGTGTIAATSLATSFVLADANIPNLNTLSTGLTGSRCVETTSGGLLTVSAALCGTGSAAFSGLTGGTNTSAAMLVGSGASLGVTGTGTIGATALSTTFVLADSNIPDLNTLSTGLTPSRCVETDGTGKLGIAAGLCGVSGATTGISGATNHGIMVATGGTTGTSLGVATNGQIPLGSTGLDPVLAVPLGTPNQIQVTPGPGSLVFSIPTSPTLPGITAGTFSGTLAGNATTATAFAANGGNCPAGQFPLGVDTLGAVEGCTDAATQAELDAHAALTTAHSATSANTASRIVLRDASGNFAAGTITAALSGNATTATQLSTNGANCPAGQFPLGVDALGAVEGCTDAATQVELDAVVTSANANYALKTGTNQRITGTYVEPREVAYTPVAGAITPNLTTTGTVVIDALTVPLTINAPTGTVVPGHELLFRLKSTGSLGITWNGIYTAGNGVPLPTSTSGTGYDYVKFIYNATTSTYGVVAFTPAGTSSGVGTPGGSPSQVQYNNAGAFGGTGGLVASATEVISWRLRPTTKAATATLTTADGPTITCDATAGAVVLTLPAASAGQGSFFIQKIDASANACTLQRGGTDTINGATGTVSITSQGERIDVLAASTTNWSAIVSIITVGTAQLSNDAVTFAKIQNMTTDRLLGRDTAGTGDPEELVVGGGLEFTGTGGIQRSALTGDVTAGAGVSATTIAANSVTYAKMLNTVTAQRLLGRGDTGAGNPQEITLGTNLSFTPGTATLNATGGSGTAQGATGNIQYNNATAFAGSTGQNVSATEVISQRLRPTVKSATSTLTTTDGPTITCNAAAGAVVLTLPAASTAQGVFNIQKIDATTNACSIIRGGSDTINGVSTALSITSQWDRIDVIATSTTAWSAIVTSTAPFSVAEGGTNVTTSPDDNVLVGNGTTWQLKALPTCTTGQALVYTAATNTYSCSIAIPATLNRSVYIPAGSMAVSGNCLLNDPAAIIANGPKLPTITCTKNNADSIEFDFVSPDAWNAGTITVQLHAFNSAAVATNTIMHFAGQCVSSGDTITAHATTGEVAATLTWTNATNREVWATTAAITLQGSCVAGDHIYMRGQIDAASTIVDISTVRLLGAKVRYVNVSSSEFVP